MHEENQVQSEEAVKDTQPTDDAVKEAPVESADQGKDAEGQEPQHSILDGASEEIVNLVKGLREENARHRQSNKRLREELAEAASAEDLEAMKARIAEYEAREELRSAQREAQALFPSVPMEVVESLSGVTVDELKSQLAAIAKISGLGAGSVRASGGGIAPAEDAADEVDVDAILESMSRRRW
jgi:hypothetical protein|nr:MAG TPA: hypothetical protein [Caudoviricetes sp.]